MSKISTVTRGYMHNTQMRNGNPSRTWEQKARRPMSVCLSEIYMSATAFFMLRGLLTVCFDHLLSRPVPMDDVLGSKSLKLPRV